MASFSELSLRDRLLLAAYPWRTVDPPAWTQPLRPLAEARVAIVTSAGFYRPGRDLPFRSMPGGDTSLRVVPVDTPLDELGLGQVSHSFDREALIADPASALPIPHLRALATAARIGSVAPRHVSINGSILAPGRLVKETGPIAAEILAQDQVDLALFVPV
jgi:D-proline reductase (dithiol) PrdB